MSGQYAPPPYTILLDGTVQTIALPPFFAPHGLTVVNDGAVSLTVTSGRGESWTVQPGGTLVAPLPVPSSVWRYQSISADTSGAVATATYTADLPAAASNTGPAPVAQTSGLVALDIAAGASQTIQMAHATSAVIITLLTVSAPLFDAPPTLTVTAALAGASSTVLLLTLPLPGFSVATSGAAGATVPLILEVPLPAGTRLVVAPDIVALTGLLSY